MGRKGERKGKEKGKKRKERKWSRDHMQIIKIMKIMQGIMLKIMKREKITHCFGCQTLRR